MDILWRKLTFSQSSQYLQIFRKLSRVVDTEPLVHSRTSQEIFRLSLNVHGAQEFVKIDDNTEMQTATFKTRKCKRENRILSLKRRKWDTTKQGLFIYVLLTCNFTFNFPRDVITPFLVWYGRANQMFARGFSEDEWIKFEYPWKDLKK